MEEVVPGPGCARYLYRGFTFMPRPTAASRQPGEAMETTPIGVPHARSLGLGLKLALAKGPRGWLTFPVALNSNPASDPG